MATLITDLDRTYRGFYVHLIGHPDDWICRGELADFLEDHTGETIDGIACEVLSNGQRWQVGTKRHPRLTGNRIWRFYDDSKSNIDYWFYRLRSDLFDRFYSILWKRLRNKEKKPGSRNTHAGSIYLYKVEQAIALALQKQGAS